MTFAATSATHTTVTDTTHTKESNMIPSIRQICLKGILAGKSTKDIAEEIKAHHPASAAAAKSAKHIAWYRAQLKAGKIKVAE